MMGPGIRLMMGRYESDSLIYIISSIYPTKKETHTVTFSCLVYLFWFKLFYK